MAEDDPLRVYYEFIGHFITQFAEVEFYLRRVLQSHSGLNDELYETLIGYPRSSEATSKLQKLVGTRISDPLAQKAIREAFDQLRHTTKLRDWIVHYGGNPTEGDKYLVRLKPTEISTATGESYHIFTRLELWAAAIDMQIIKHVLIYHLEDSLPPDFRETLAMNAVRKEPWRYKPPQLAQSQR